tara:strand:- start:12 stop:269 length:258 start_codon:yes stop_codon:yes gene_type:complete
MQQAFRFSADATPQSLWVRQNRATPGVSAAKAAFNPSAVQQIQPSDRTLTHYIGAFRPICAHVFGRRVSAIQNGITSRVRDGNGA